jgi:peptidoglycan hydrolase-like protein with peptidoglycan-binding domain
LGNLVRLIMTVVVVVFGAIGTLILVRSSAATTCANQTVGKGNAGQCVTDIQEMLNGFAASHVLYPKTYNYAGSRLPTDGVFGTGTYSQVRYFQDWSRINDDGVVGKQTWAELCIKADNLPYAATKLTAANQQAAKDVNAAYSGKNNSKCKA